MDISDVIDSHESFMAQAFQDLRDLVEELKNDRGQGLSEEEAEVPESDNLFAYGGGLETADTFRYDDEDEFPIPRSFRWQDLDPNDPEFATGKSIGLPVAVVIRNDLGQDRLLPIIDGRFSSGGL